MGILDLLLGKKLIKNDDFFGKMESDNTRSNDSTKPLSWSINKRIGHFKNETFIILEGNFKDINPIQKKELKNFIENFDTIFSNEIDKLIESDIKLNVLKDWRSEYYITFICPKIKSNTDFEINFEIIDNNNHFSIELISGKLSNLNILA